MILGHLLTKLKMEKLSEYEVLHIISDARYARGVLLGEQNKTTNLQQYHEVSKLLKRMSWRWKLRWSHVEQHSGVFGNLLADSLAKKNARVSNLRHLIKPEPPKFHWWNEEKSNETVTQAIADQWHQEWLTKYIAGRATLQKRWNHQANFCKCPKEFVNYFKTNSKNTSDVQVQTVDRIKIGTELEIWWPGDNSPGWHAGTVTSLTWVNNQLYHELKWANKRDTPMRLHLDHYRIRRLKNEAHNPLGRS